MQLPSTQDGCSSFKSCREALLARLKPLEQPFIFQARAVFRGGVLTVYTDFQLTHWLPSLQETLKAQPSMNVTPCQCPLHAKRQVGLASRVLFLLKDCNRVAAPGHALVQRTPQGWRT